MDMISFSRPHARATPTTHPAMESARLSARNCANKRQREAPSEARTATSFWRVVARASSRFATLAQAISSTKPTAPINSHIARMMSRSRKSFFSGSTFAPQP